MLGSEGSTAQLASQLISQRESVGGAMSVARRRQSTTESDQVIIEPAVLLAEIEQFPNLAGYAMTTSVSSWYRVNFRSDLGG